VKAISIQQPWAWAILHAGKDIENRTWSTSFRGELAVHATSVQAQYQLPPGVTAPAERELTTRAVVGVVEVVEVTTRSRSRWFTGPYGFVLRNVRPLERPLPCRGNLRLWDLPVSIEKQLRQQLVTAMAAEAAAPTVAARLPEAVAMDLTQAVQIIEELAAGRSPLTGSPLAAEDICRQPQVVDALGAVVSHLRAVKAPPPSTGTPPSKAGQAWTPQEDAELLGEFAGGATIPGMAQTHGRTAQAIRGRLYRLGKLADWSA
jgi:hypothetical protein